MGRRGYAAEFRQRVLDLVAAGRRVEDIARDLGISDQTVYSWRRQERVDRGLESGPTRGERAELISARRRIREHGFRVFGAETAQRPQRTAFLAPDKRNQADRKAMPTSGSDKHIASNPTKTLPLTA
jgi:transposase-like protein